MYEIKYKDLDVSESSADSFRYCSVYKIKILNYESSICEFVFNCSAAHGVENFCKSCLSDVY